MFQVNIPKIILALVVSVFISALFVLFANPQNSSTYQTSISKFFRPEAVQSRTIEIRVLKNQWAFYPENIAVQQGEDIVLKIYNEDEYAHGFAIGVLGINALLPPEKETIIEFTAAKTGAFGFYCSVPCGEGHYRMKGKMQVSNSDTNP